MKLFEAVDDVLKGKEKVSFDMVSLDNIIVKQVKTIKKYLFS